MPILRAGTIEFQVSALDKFYCISSSSILEII
jgi:hypothetical protein